MCEREKVRQRSGECGEEMERGEKRIGRERGEK